MAPAKRTPNSDGQNKKHDLPIHHHRWQPAPTVAMRSWAVFRRRRILLALLALLAVYLFVKYIPTDVPSVAHRTDSLTGQSWARPDPFRSNPLSQKQPAQLHEGTVVLSRGQLYEGPVKFYNLVTSLRPHIYPTGRAKPRVVFALFDLKSTASLLAFACEMAAYNRTELHIAVLAPRNDPLDDIAHLSGLDQSQCVAYWHDARPDYNLQSSPARRKVVAQAQIGHLGSTLHPKLFVVDQAQAHHTDFLDAIRERLDGMRIPLLVLPNDPVKSMNWATSLDVHALQYLNRVQIDIHITPDPDSSGPLLALLESIQQANYVGVPTPRITIELPNYVEHFALEYIENMHWPPGCTPSPNQLVIRRRVGSSPLPANLAALRTVESFYPPSGALSHLLVLKPNVKLSPDYMQFLMYTTLAYKYGRLGLPSANHLMGVALDLPPSLTSTAPTSPLLLHQKVPGQAAMYFGDKWIELHTWLSHRLKKDKDLTRTVSTDHTSETAHEPWAKEIQLMMQSLNYFMLNPTFTQSPEAKLMTTNTEALHNQNQYDSSGLPEDDSNAETISQILSDAVLAGDDIAVKSKAATQAHDTLPLARLLAASQNTGPRSGPPAGHQLGLFSVENEALTWDRAQQMASKFADKVSLELGDCPSLDAREAHKTGSVDFLFCDTG